MDWPQDETPKREGSGEASRDFPASSIRPLGPEATELIEKARDLCRLGRAADASEHIHRLMDATGGIKRPEILYVYADYLLRRGRPFAARCALMPLLRQKPADPGAKLLYARALSEAGKLPKALELVERLANAKSDVSMEAAALFDRLFALKDEAGNPSVVEPVRAALFEQAGVEGDALFGPDMLGRVDGVLSQFAAENKPAAASHVEPWAYYLGEYCRHHLKGRWNWRQRIGDASMTVRMGQQRVEFSPSTWVRWRLENTGARLSQFVRTLFRFSGAGTVQFRALSGAPESSENLGSDLMSLALKTAAERAAIGDEITGLGVVADCPFAQVRIPLVIRESDEPVVVILQESATSSDAFKRWLDMLCLTRYGRGRWHVAGFAGVMDEELRFYQRPDPPVRAALLARRLVSDAPARNARWAVTVVEHLLDVSLDGSTQSLKMVEQSIWEQFRSGTPSRWGPVFDDRFAILFLMTCYVGEVLRAHFGGRWGGDRLTGRPIGPTSGLELPHLRYNLGAKVLKTFYLGQDGPLVDSAVEYANRAGEQSTR